MKWISIAAGTPVEFGVLQGKSCVITLEVRPSYCDRGRYVAKLLTFGAFSREVDFHDGWPRYYFSLEAATSESEAWLRCRHQWTDDEREALPLEAVGIKQ